MRILLVGTGVHSIPPMHGGAVEKIEATLLKEFSKSHEVYITDIEKHDHGIFIKKYNFPQPLTEVIFGFRSLIASIRIKPDITHCHTVFTALPFAIFNRKFGRAVIRDQKAIKPELLVKCLPSSITVNEWCKYLNRKVFFWASWTGLKILLSANEYFQKENHPRW